MKILFFFLIFIPFISLSQLTNKQTLRIDSLQQLIKTTKQDSTIVNSWVAWDNIIYAINPKLDLLLNQKIDSLCTFNLEKLLTNKEKSFFLKKKAFALNNIGVINFYQSNYDKAIQNYSESLKIKEKIGDKKGAAKALNVIGVIYKDQGNYDKAIAFHTNSLKINEELGNKKDILRSLNYLGNVYTALGDYDKAIENYSQSLTIGSEIDDKKGLAISFNGIGNIYSLQGDFEKAIEYFTKSFSIVEELRDHKKMAVALNNIGDIYSQQKDYDKAMEYFSKSLKINTAQGKKIGIAYSLNNIGFVFYDKGELNTATQYFTKSLSIREEIGDKQGVSACLTEIGKIYFKQGEHVKAMEYSKRSLVIAQKIGAAIEIRHAANSLSKINKKLGRYKESLEMYELYITTRDSMESEANQKEVIRHEYKYAYEKKAAADSIFNAEEKKVANALLTAEKAENKQQKQQSYFLYSGLALAILFLVFIYNRFRISQKQREIIEAKKSEVELQKEKVDEAYNQLEEKNSEILSSINYAKRIQSAILPSDKMIKESLQNSFIIYKPKDIVAGDFYWMEDINDTILFAVADCTGHGVPGAMVSVVCHNAMNRAVREYNLTEPGEILDKVRSIVIEEFEKSDDDVKDGMDIALCSLKGNQLKYAGAHNPLWIIRNGEILETKANKEPIGKFHHQTPFTTHSFELEKGDTIYIFSDGFVDQFGGEREKKFKPANLRKLLLSVQNQDLTEQRLTINKTFEDWKGDLEQVDDVCMIGVRIN